ncbi:MAG: DUF2848 domain-containing protein [Chloroflexi bacterium]|nr:DUF2848 domain-containing protein [Chloroflexota bacterium]
MRFSFGMDPLPDFHLGWASGLLFCMLQHHTSNRAVRARPALSRRSIRRSKISAVQESALDTSPHLVLTDAQTHEPFRFPVRRVILAGYTGRDRETVLRHIRELETEGIAPPPSVPVHYPGLLDGVQVNGTVPARLGWASGEIEFVLFVAGEAVYVGVGSDHTDRDLERASIEASKQAAGKVVGADVWLLESLLPQWDELVLRSWVTQGTMRVLYQQGTLGMIMPPHDLLGLVPVADRGPGLVLYSGTVPLIQRAPTDGTWRFEGQLLRATGEVLARCQYTYMAAPGKGLPSRD